jgi:hypothetical protein
MLLGEAKREAPAQAELHATAPGNRSRLNVALSWPFGPWSLDISKDGFRAAAQSVAKELGGRRGGSRWQTAA